MSRTAQPFRLGVLALATSALVTGCSLFAPYDSEFQCQRNRDYGKCTDVQGAYTEALGGDATPEHPVTDPKDKSGKRREHAEGETDRSREDQVIGRAAISRYKAAEYNEMAGLIEKPVTPVVAPPKVLRTLVVAYSTSEKTLFLPRYVYFFASDANFVVGDYLNAEGASDASTVYPNGTTPAFR
jgi:conjugal transfer pilus assembly protein TraV